MENLELRKDELEDEARCISAILEIKSRRLAMYSEEEAAQRYLQRQKVEVQQRLGLSSEEADIAVRYLN